MSTFATFIDKIESQKSILFEMDLEEDQSFWIPFEAGTWKVKPTFYIRNQTYNYENGAFCYGGFEASGTSNLGNSPYIKNIGSFWVNNVAYTEATSVSNMTATNQSYYYDTDKTLYVHFNNGDPPSNFRLVEIDVIHGFSNREQYLENNHYSGRVISIPNISKSADPLYFGIIKFE